ncbi:MAG: MBL fold metallo-hydrolase [Calditrichota bacterium]
MKIHKLTLGYFAVNNYLIHSENSSKAILIDACEDYPSILRAIEENNLELAYLINTHGHADHMAGNRAILEATGAKLLAHKKAVPLLLDPKLNLSVMISPITSPEPDQLLEEGDTVTLDDIKLDVLFTPGHAPGHISLIGDGLAFSGDVIFRGSIGRTDFPGCSYQDLERSILDKIYTLPDETVLYNGHGPETTVGHEKATNPFVRPQ